MAKKTSCPISRAAFLSKAPKIKIQIGDHKFDAIPRQFGTGSLGWNVNGKITIEIDGIDVPVQVGLNLTLVGSKELPEAEGSAPRAEAAPTEGVAPAAS
ncbi:MAG: hypothetical protein LC745_13525 [Planctomycetia bacterium]|nr:hypothetical protein [Planctomycetia bacterium]